MSNAVMTYKNRDDMTRSVVTLPPEEQAKLVEIRASGDLPALRQRVYALRQAKWPLRAIGDPLDTPRSTVRMWEMNADADGEIPSVPECERAQKDRGERTIRLYLDVPPAARPMLSELAPTARMVRGRTPKTDPSRVAADRLDELISKYIDRKIPIKYIAQHMGVTSRAVTARHERYLERKSSDV